MPNGTDFGKKLVIGRLCSKIVKGRNGCQGVLALHQAMSKLGCDGQVSRHGRRTVLPLAAQCKERWNSPTSALETGDDLATTIEGNFEGDAMGF